MALIHIETRDKNLPDSGAWQIHKFGTATGEQRIALEGNWEKDDKLFDFYTKDVEFYFFTKSDMLDYISSIQEEIYHPTQKYSYKEYPSFYQAKVEEIKEYPQDIIVMHFEPNPRTGGTAYLASVTNTDSDRYNFLRSICLSSEKQGKKNAYTTFFFVKYQDTRTGKYYINIVPTFSKRYTMGELSKILKRELNNAEDIHVAISLFGLKYAGKIIAEGYSTKELMHLAGYVDDAMVSGLEIAVRVYKFLADNKITINPISEKLALLGTYIENQSHSTIKSDERDNPTQQITSSFRPFITAIKSKPFLLLAGISGTGKSRIVRELARACWDVGSEEYKAQKPRNFEMVQVKPNWHDSSELIGYVSRIDGVRYVVGPFLKFIVKAMQDPNTPYFLCLDEMNLAPVEQYFAEYLSVIESRKKQEDGTITTDPIVDYSNTEEYGSLIHQLFPDDDDLRKAYLTEDGGKRLSIPQNLIVVGTVNMDETTFSFSRKVLDRAMTIEMNEVDLRGGLTERHEKIGKIGVAELIGIAVEGVDVYKPYENVCKLAIEYLEAINDKLEGTPFKIAYRTRNEALLYVVNNLPYNKGNDGEELQREYVIARALDEITNMKILSRIEGDETKVSSKFLEELDGTIKSGLETICPTLFTDDGYASVSSSKIDEMKKRLASGYTSFWS